MEVFNFPFHERETQYPKSGSEVQFGKGWTFTSAPSQPFSREFTLTFRGMTYYESTDPAVRVKSTVYPGNNMSTMETFYQRHELWKEFWFYHPTYGYTKCRFKEPLKVPKGLPGRGGMVDEFNVVLVEVPGLVGFENSEIPPTTPPPLPVVPGLKGSGAVELPSDFDALLYLASNPDLIVALGLDLPAAELHYSTFGYSEGRSYTSFNVAQYLRNYPDLQTSLGDDTEAATEHWILHGYAEGRTDANLTGGSPDPSGDIGLNEVGLITPGFFIMTTHDDFIIEFA